MVLLLIVSTIYSCDTEKITPASDFVIEDEEGNTIDSAVVGVPVVFRSLSTDAEFDVIWPGDSSHQYGVRDVPNTNENPTTEFLPGSGFAMGEDGIVSYTYSKAGSYTVTLVSTTVNQGLDIATNTKEKNLIVVE